MSELMNHKQALVVENEQIIALDLELRLGCLGYEVSIETTGAEAVKTAGRLKPQIILMDIELDGPMDGIQAAEQIRKEFYGALIFLTAHADDRTLERAAQVNPSAYLVKPFNDRSLVAATYLSLFKSQHESRNSADDAPSDNERKREPSVVHIGGLKIDFVQRTVFRGEREIRLTKKEFSILQSLVEYQGAPLSPEVILSRVWGPQFVHYVQTLRVHVGNLRQKLQEDCPGIRIEALRGVGYRLTVDCLACEQSASRNVPSQNDVDMPRS